MWNLVVSIQMRNILIAKNAILQYQTENSHKTSGPLLQVQTVADLLYFTFC